MLPSLKEKTLRLEFEFDYPVLFLYRFSDRHGRRKPNRCSEGISAKVPKPGAPLIAISTTAGTGGEVTQFTLITDIEGRSNNDNQKGKELH